MPPRVTPPTIPGAAPQARGSVAAGPLASPAAVTPRARAPRGSEAPPRQSPTPARALETARRPPPQSGSKPRMTERDGVPHARALPRAEPTWAEPRGSRAAPPLPSARERPRAPHRPALPVPEAPASPRGARPMRDAADHGAHAASRPRSPERGASPPRAPARLGGVEVTGRAPRLRLRACPAPAPAEAEPRTFDPSDVLPARPTTDRASLRPREPGRAGAASRVAGVTASPAPSPSPYAAAAHGPELPARRVAASSRIVSERLGAIETDRSLLATDRSLENPDAGWPPLASPLAPLPAARENGNPPQRFPELPRRDEGAPATRATLDDWPELPPRAADVALAAAPGRCDQLLREQSEV